MLAGYVICRTCKGQTLEYLAYQTNGDCWSCFQRNPTLRRAAELEIAAEGAIAQLQRATSFSRARVLNGQPRAYADTKAMDRTRSRAFYRLSRRHFEEFHLLWQEERIKEGMPPRVSAQLNVMASAVKTIDDRLRYLRYIPGDDDHADQPQDA